MSFATQSLPHVRSYVHDLPSNLIVSEVPLRRGQSSGNVPIVGTTMMPLSVPTVVVAAGVPPVVDCEDPVAEGVGVVPGVVNAPACWASALDPC